MTDQRLTVAESLIIETLILGTINGASRWTFDRDGMWLCHHLDDLAHKGLLTWKWDEQANFAVTPTPALRDHEAFQRVCNKITATTTLQGQR